MHQDYLAEVVDHFLDQGLHRSDVHDLELISVHTSLEMSRRWREYVLSAVKPHFVKNGHQRHIRFTGACRSAKE